MYFYQKTNVNLWEFSWLPRGPSNKGDGQAMKRATLLFLSCCNVFQNTEVVGRCLTNEFWHRLMSWYVLCCSLSVWSSAHCWRGVISVRRQTDHPSWPLGTESLLSHHHWSVMWGWEAWKYVMLLPLAQESLWILSLLSVPAGKAPGDYFSTLGELLCTNHWHNTSLVLQRKNKIAPDKGL